MCSDQSRYGEKTTTHHSIGGDIARARSVTLLQGLPIDQSRNAKKNTAYRSRGSGIARARSVALLRGPPIDQSRYAIQGHLECAVISRGMGKKQPRTVLEVVISREPGRSPFYEAHPWISRGMRKKNTTHRSIGGDIARAWSVTLLQGLPIDQSRYAKKKYHVPF
jgi:hypothetical protein